MVMTQHIKNVVLVHGAFADGSGWEAVANILKNDGYRVSVVQHPETSYAEDQKYTKAAIDAMGGPVVLVGHSCGDTEKYLGEIKGLDSPLLMHLAEEDEFISKPAQAEIKAALAGKRNATVYSYPGQHHAFARHNGAHYNAAAATLANGRTSNFLHQQLRTKWAG
jgi:acetyl esterase/lipase